MGVGVASRLVPCQSICRHSSRHLVVVIDDLHLGVGIGHRIDPQLSHLQQNVLLGDVVVLCESAAMFEPSVGSVWFVRPPICYGTNKIRFLWNVQMQLQLTVLRGFLHSI